MRVVTLPVGGLGTNCYIVWDEGSGIAAVIDPGDEPERILRELADRELELKYIFLTHGHFDHILAAPRLREKTGAETVIHALDADCLTDENKALARYRKGDTGAPADILAGDRDSFSAGALTFSYLHTPGHTRGSCVILCGGYMFSGDTLFEGDCGRCDLPGGDYNAMLHSLRKLAGLETDYKVCPGHGPSTALNTEKNQNIDMLKAERLRNDI